MGAMKSMATREMLKRIGKDQSADGILARTPAWQLRPQRRIVKIAKPLPLLDNIK